MNANIQKHIESAQESGASDLFLSEGSPARLKVHGVLSELGREPLSAEDLTELWQACGADPAELNDFDAAYETADGTRFRVNLFRHTGRLGAVLRQIKTQIPNMEALGLPDYFLVPWMQQPNGLVLVTGATGSGKSTTLASCIEWVNHNLARHIVTIEDPIEFRFNSQLSLCTQREVHTDTESFGRGLKSSLRQAPDVILVGEIRDPETATIALQAAETGHLVLSTLHSSGVTDTLERLTNLFPNAERESALQLLSSQLIGILCQKLLPNPDGSGMQLIIEHFQNEGATRKWIKEVALAEIMEFVNRGDNPNNRSFMNCLVAACKAGLVDEATAIAASGNEFEFGRAMRGVS